MFFEFCWLSHCCVFCNVCNILISPLATSLPTHTAQLITPSTFPQHHIVKLFSFLFYVLFSLYCTVLYCIVLFCLVSVLSMYCTVLSKIEITLLVDVLTPTTVFVLLVPFLLITFYFYSSLSLSVWYLWEDDCLLKIYQLGLVLRPCVRLSLSPSLFTYTVQYHCLPFCRAIVYSPLSLFSRGWIFSWIWSFLVFCFLLFYWTTSTVTSFEANIIYSLMSYLSETCRK
jgi:hypothetical protein